MSSDSPLQISRCLLAALGTRMFLYYENRIPRSGAVLVVSNHRSFMDAPLLMVGVGRPIRFACHHYMGQVPLLREMVTMLGAFPLEEPDHRQQGFLHQATRFLQAGEIVGVFPEGAPAMVQSTNRQKIGEFQRGFAHLAIRSLVSNLAVLPIAIASIEEKVINSAIPLKLFSLFDPTEPLFNQDGWHPMVIYSRINILIGKPYWISASDREHYQGKQVKRLITDLTDRCQTEIADLIRQGCY